MLQSSVRVHSLWQGLSTVFLNKESIVRHHVTLSLYESGHCIYTIFYLSSWEILASVFDIFIGCYAGTQPTAFVNPSNPAKPTQEFPIEFLSTSLGITFAQ